LNNLSMLDNGGICVALVPTSCVVAQEGKELELKKRLMKTHTLEAVMSLPEDLFHNSKVGVVTCALVIKAHHPHKSNKKTWLGYWRNDGFVKVKGKGRIDKNNQWAAVRHEWVQAYQNREADYRRSAIVHLTPEAEWCVEAYLRTDYSDLSQERIERELRKYLAYEIISEDT
jgi:type I restriction enzyme M protein